jgi:hypothetical protein
MDTWRTFPGVKRPGREANHSPPYSAEVKKAWRYTPIPHYVFMAWCFVKHMEKFTFTSNLFILVGKPELKRPLGRPRRRWEDNIRMDLKETVWEGVN